MTNELRHPSAHAARKCAEWLTWCRENGWPRESTGRLADIWWKFHDDQGNLMPGSPPDTNEGTR